MELFRGNIIDTPTPDALRVLEHGYIAVEDGKVVYAGNELPRQYAGCHVTDYGDCLIIPGFVDVHVHAPQWCNSGLGFSLELLPWLQNYTFPAEAGFADAQFAKVEYTRFVNELLKHGTLRASIFASRHCEATRTLIDTLESSGIGAYVGKVNMDRNSIPELEETCEESLRETRELIEYVQAKHNPKLHYILTPRYVPCTTPDLMRGLALIGEEYGLPVQSHLDENRDEVAWVQGLHPECKSFADVYEHYGLMRDNQTIMAHCIHMKDEEIALLKQKNVLVAHCAMSNADLASGIMPLRKYLDEGMWVAIASDMGGSHTVKMAEHIVDTIKSSKLYWVYHPEYKPVSFSESFYMATKSGGKFFGKVGAFEKDYEFDALVIDDSSIQTMISHSLEERLERFIYLGASECIRKRYVSGKECCYPLASEE